MRFYVQTAFDADAEAVGEEAISGDHGGVLHFDRRLYLQVSGRSFERIEKHLQDKRLPYEISGLVLTDDEDDEYDDFANLLSAPGSHP